MHHIIGTSSTKSNRARLVGANSVVRIGNGEPSLTSTNGSVEEEGGGREGAIKVFCLPHPLFDKSD